MRHPYADLIIAWAEGAEIEYKDPEMGLWFNWRSTSWNDDLEYRIKPSIPEWARNVPEHGILIKNKISGEASVLFSNMLLFKWDEWEPLTNDEIERFKR